tara:strand:- start:1388 stop:1537 length:150 start_codon:yes stop_codon:yes gene_type:complete
MKKKYNKQDQAWFLHLESIRKMEEAIEDGDKELHQIINYIGFQTNRAKA